MTIVWVRNWKEEYFCSLIYFKQHRVFDMKTLVRCSSIQKVKLKGILKDRMRFDLE